MGFMFNGKHSSSIKGLGVKTIKNEIMPEIKEVTIDSNFIDGEYDFSFIDGRPKFRNRTFEKELFLIGNNKEELNDTIREVVRWLNVGYAELIMDEYPDLVWTAKIGNKMDFERQLFRCGIVSIFFIAKPYAKIKAGEVTLRYTDIGRGGYIPVYPTKLSLIEPLITVKYRNCNYITISDNVTSTGLRGIVDNSTAEKTVVFDCENKTTTAKAIEGGDYFKNWGFPCFYNSNKEYENLYVGCDGDITEIIVKYTEKVII